MEGLTDVLIQAAAAFGGGATFVGLAVVWMRRRKDAVDEWKGISDERKAQVVERDARIARLEQDIAALRKHVDEQEAECARRIEQAKADLRAEMQRQASTTALIDHPSVGDPIMGEMLKRAFKVPGKDEK